MLGWVQICPLHVVKRELRTDQFKGMGANIDVEGTVEESAEVEPARGEDRSLSIQRAVGIILRRSGSDAVSLYNNAMN